MAKPTWEDYQMTESPKYSDFVAEEFKYNPFTASEDLLAKGQAKTDAENAVNNYGDFVWQDQKKYDEYLNNYENRPDFSYDLNGDALYQQYKDKYMKQGKMAMADTIGQAAAMTGGYGNSYAATAGNQAYQASLENLNDIVPELYQLAYDRYNQEGQDMLNMISLLGNERDFAYGQWGDGYNRLVAERDYAASDYDTSYNREYGVWSDNYDKAYQKWSDETNIDLTNHDNEYNHKMSVWETENDIGLKNHTNAYNDAWKQAEWNYQTSQDALDRDEGNARDFLESEGRIGYDNGSVSSENIKILQEALGITADGKWGSGSKEASGGLTADQAWKAYQDGKLGKADVTYDDLVEDLNYFIKQGASKSETNSYLREALQSGYITQAEYNKLKKIYAPRGYTYGSGGGGRTKDTVVDIK